jgi:hypothetical protein
MFASEAVESLDTGQPLSKDVAAPAAFSPMLHELQWPLGAIPQRDAPSGSRALNHRLVSTIMSKDLLDRFFCKSLLNWVELCQEIVVADQMRGFTVPCDWADFGRVELSGGQLVSVAQLKGTTCRQVFCPEGWKYEGSLSQQFGFVPAGQESKSLRFLRHENGLDVYLNVATGKEVYVGRTGA